MKNNFPFLFSILPSILYLLPPTQPAPGLQNDSPIQPGDILINEILSNPHPNGVDFVELYNLSGKTIDLQQLTIASVNSKGVTGNPRKITRHPIHIHPYEYKVLTSSPSLTRQHYTNSNPATFIEMPDLPDFNNEMGGVVLFCDNQPIDSLFYTPEMRSPFVANPKGISLERQSFTDPTNSAGNFHSAATTVGGATPGYPNSQSPEPADRYGFSLQSPTFSPDNDGFEDQLKINYLLQESGWMVNINIYNANGHRVKQLQRNQSLGTHGEILWDGQSDAGQLLPIGIYVAVVEGYHPGGDTKRYRLSFVLAARL